MKWHLNLFLECLPSRDAVNNVLEGICLRWTAAEREESETCVNGLKNENNHTAARGWLGVSSLENTLSNVRIVG